MMRLRELQDETGGFTAFITWSYQPEHTELGGDEATGVDYLRTLALVAHRARQLRQPAGVVGHAGRQGRPAQPGLRRQRHGQRDDRRERRPRGRRQLLHGRGRDRRATSRTPASPPSAATCTTRCSAIRSSASATCRACWRWPTARADGDTRCPPSSTHYPGAEPRRRKHAPTQQLTRCRLPRRLGAADRGAADSRRLGGGRGGRIVADRHARAASRRRSRLRPRRRARSCPALVNAHTHLELSYLRDGCRRPPRFARWVRGADGAAAAASGSRPRRRLIEAIDAGHRRGRAAAPRWSATSATRS